MIYKMTLADSADSMTFDLLEVPIADKDVEGAVDNTLVNGNVFTDYLWLKKQWTQKWALMCDDEYTQLRGFYTRQWENAEAPTYRLFYGNNIDTYDTQSGDYILVNIDAPLGATMSLDSISGNSTQQTLPTGFQSVESIESDGTQFIDTDFPIFATKTWKIDVEFELNILYNYNAIVGFSDGDPNKESWVYDNGNYAWRVLGTAKTSGLAVLSANTKYKISHDNLANNFVMRVNGAEVWNTTKTTGTASLPLWIGHRAYGGWLKGKLYRITLYNADGKVCDMIPAIRQSDSAVGMYDVVRQRFIENAGTGVFVAGSQTTIPNPDMAQPIQTVTEAQTLSIMGENKLAPIEDYTETKNTVVFTSQNGVYSLTGTATAGTSTTLKPVSMQYTIRTGDYLHIGNDKVNSSIAFVIRFTDGTTISPTTQSLQRIFDLSPYVGKTVMELYIYVANGVNTNNMTLKPMILATNQASVFKQFNAQTQEINLGKNLLNPDSSEWQQGYWTYGGGALIAISNRVCQINKTLVSEDTTFTMTTNENIAFRVDFWNADGTASGQSVAWFDPTSTNLTKTFTVPANMRYTITLGWKGGGTPISPSDVASFNLQLERGIKSSSYAPYFTPIELAKIGNYKDRIWNDDGVWKIHKELGKAVFDGSEVSGSFQADTNTSRLLCVFPSGCPTSPSGATLPLCDYFIGKLMWSSDEAGVYVQTDRAVFRGDKSVVGSTEADFKAWFVAHPTTVYYALATPTDTEITDDTLLAQLNTISELYGGQNNIMLVPSARAQGTMEVKIHSIYERETEIYPQTAVRLTLTDDGIINPCGCRRNVQIKMRETIQ